MRLAVRLLLLALAASAAPAAGANEFWRAEQADASKYPAAIVEEKRAPAPSGIPGMLTAEAPGAPDIVAAWYSQPTSRYRHGALGDTVEGGALSVRTADGRTLTYRLPETEVFEDIAPRLADLDLDGSTEVVAILASVTRGAAVAVFGLAGDVLARKAVSSHVGKPNRWLNIAAIDRFISARGTPEIAFVTTPHIGGTLAFMKYVTGGFVVAAAQRDFSNHVLGAQELRLSAVADTNGDGRMELALPSNDRRTLRIMGFTSDGLKEIGSARLPSAIDKAVLAEGTGRETAFVVGLEDGTVWRVAR